MTQTITTALERLDKKECSSVELVEECLRVIDERDSEVSAYLEVFDDVKEDARRADEVRAAGGAPALCGIPIAIKDNILIKGRKSTAGSQVLDGYVAPYSATVIEKLKTAGAVLLGRTNLDEFAMGSSTENSSFRPTKNPLDTTRVPGGSSGGSAAAVAMEGAYGALGSDTGGSIRQPASFCGIVGLKPTYGSVSRHGLIAMGSSLDVIGPLTRSVADAELLYRTIAGKDIYDGTSRDAGDDTKAPKIIGVPRHFFEKGIDPDVLEVFNAHLAQLEKEGYEVRDITLPNVEHSLASYYIVMPAEASANLARFDGVRFGKHVDGATLFADYAETRGEGFGREVKRRILIGTYVLSSGYYDAYYVRAQALRKEITRAFITAFKEVDVVAMPTTPAPAFKIGEKSDPLSMYLTDIFTVPANLTGMPALSLPAGTVERDGVQLPVGFQLCAPHVGEGRLFALGKALEKSTPEG